MCHALGIVAMDRIVELSTNLDPDLISEFLLERHDRVGEKRSLWQHINALRLFSSYPDKTSWFE